MPTTVEYTTATIPASVGEKLPENIPIRMMAGAMMASTPSFRLTPKRFQENLVAGGAFSPRMNMNLHAAISIRPTRMPGMIPALNISLTLTFASVA